MRPSSLLSRRHLLAALAAGVALGPSRALAAPPGDSWLQNHHPATLWEAADGARALGAAPQWSHLKVIGAPRGGRIPVHDARIGASGWVDAALVGPSGPPTPSKVVAPTAAPFATFWVAPHRAAPLLPSPEAGAPPLVLLAPFGPLRVEGPARGDYYPVEEPFARVRGWVAADAVGAVGRPDAVGAGQWWGRVVADEVVARAEPSRRAAPVAEYPNGTTLGFSGWVEGEMVHWDDPTWGEVAPGVYVYGRLTRPIELDAPPAPRLADPPTGRWIGVNRTLQLIVGYEDAQPLLWAQTSTGRPGWETPLGRYTISRRVARETMDSRTLLGRDAERATYKIENVRYTQYFSGDGNAIHENWWKDQDTFGIPSSHGCAGLRPDDAERFWEFGAIGMPLIVHG